MPTLQLVKEAIKALKDRNGSSVVAITKWIENEKKASERKRYDQNDVIWCGPHAWKEHIK